MERNRAETESRFDCDLNLPIVTLTYRRVISETEV